MEYYLIRPCKDNSKATKEAILRGLALAKSESKKLILVVSAYSQARDSSCLRVALGAANFAALNKNRRVVIGSVDIHLMTTKSISEVGMGFQGVIVYLWPQDNILRTITTDLPNIKAILALEWNPESLEGWRREMNGTLITLE
ncbi:hypothetical protein [Buttiauxella izardii]|uniref:Uncharacterized protein n=1 Tax=Buttiauxella izardii TaxID=82991 RepID=A0A3A5JVE9_9ENTR|nr:hypothetical protein [Buttiauxella izardii]RJT26908.1 hypothetical protein D6029_03735 [Buttiauxella izardii]